MINRTSFVLCLAATLLCSSCSTGRKTAKWTETSIDGPWVAPGIHAREFTREYFAGIMDAGVTGDTAWTTANGGRRDARLVADSVDRYLKQRGLVERWPESGATIDGYRKRVAPFTFHIVAIEPTVVLMVPHDFGDPRGNRSINDIVGFSPKQSFSSRWMLNHIEYGSTLPYHADILWFSPESRDAPAPLTRRGDLEQELTRDRTKLVMKKDGNLWMTRRE